MITQKILHYKEIFTRTDNRQIQHERKHWITDDIMKFIETRENYYKLAQES